MLSFQKKHLQPTQEKVSILIALLFIYGAQYIPALEPYYVQTLVGTMVVLAVIAAVNKSWVDVVSTLFIGAVFFFARLKFDQVDPYSFTFRTAAITAFAYLNLALLIGPWARFTKWFRNFYKHRRHIGVTMFLLALLHASLVMSQYFNYSLGQAFASTFVFFGFTGLFILFFMAVTSWDHVQVHFKNSWWKVAHPLLLAVYVGLILYMRSVSLDLATWHVVLLSAFILFWLLVAPWSLPRVLLKQVKGWKQLHMLVYIVYASIITHMWTGVVQLQADWIQAVFWTLIGITALSHAVGWVMVIVKHVNKKRTGQPEALNGTQMAKVGSVDSFEDGRGQRFELPNGVPVAVFKNGDSFFTMSAICPHQNGPIENGIIVNGFVECPWHRWQFNTADGSGPPEYPDCIPYYETLVRNGVVYVAIEPTGKCQDNNGHTEFSR